MPLASHYVSAASLTCGSLHLTPTSSDHLSGYSSTSFFFFYRYNTSGSFQSQRKYIEQLLAFDEMKGSGYIPGCQDNYENGPNVRILSFPTNSARKQKLPKWVTRDEFVLKKPSRVSWVTWSNFFNLIHRLFSTLWEVLPGVCQGSNCETAQ